MLCALCVGTGAAAAFAGVYVLARALPGADWVAFIVGFVVFLVVLAAISLLSDGSWLVTALAIVPGLFTLIMTLDLPVERELARRGEPVDVIVLSHEVSGIRYVRHRYVLVRPDGTRLAEELIYRGPSGYGLEAGDRTTVLVDPDGKIPLEMQREVDPPGARAGLLFSGGWLALMIAVAAWVGHRRRRRLDPAAA